MYAGIINKICPASSVGIEHPPSKRSVIGSSPMRGAIYGVIAQLGERLPCKQEVASSILANSTTGFGEAATLAMRIAVKQLKMASR